MREIILFVIMFVAVLVILGAMVGYAKLIEWQEARRMTVKGLGIAPPLVMSRAADEPSPFAPSALETDSRQTPDRRMIPIPTDDEMLDIFRVLRAAGVRREALQTAWRAAGLPLNNNLWTKAAPVSEEPASVTPIAQRPLPSHVKFHEDDPTLAYEPPPR